MIGQLKAKATLFALAAHFFGLSAAHALTIDKGFYGFWDLNVSKSKFAPGPQPKAGLVSWNKNGFTFSILNGDGSIYADGLTTRDGCWPIGLEDNWSCEISAASLKHVHLIMKRDDKIRRVGDIELLPDGTTRTTHQVFPLKGASYVETTVWDREKD